MELLDAACRIRTGQASDGRAVRNKIPISGREKLVHRAVYQLSFLVSAFCVLLKKSLQKQRAREKEEDGGGRRRRRRSLPILFLIPVSSEFSSFV